MTTNANNSDDDIKITPLSSYVLDRLPPDIMIGRRDLNWLNKCSNYLLSPPTNKAVTYAVERALKRHPDMHDDPFELLIEAKICNTSCKPLPQDS